MRAALRHLAQHGVEALKPQKVVTPAVQVHGRNVKPAKHVWRRPVVSKRVGNDLRKQAIQQGTFGAFDPTSGVGWDPVWDLVLKHNTYKVTRYGGMQPAKKTKRERTREDRAKKLEEALETRTEKMEDYYAQKEGSRVEEKGFEAYYKRLIRGSTKT
jgi:hypothetical protein